MEEEVKIGDIVILKNTHNHFSDAPGYNSNITFSAIDIESELLIHDIIAVNTTIPSPPIPGLPYYEEINLAYKVACRTGFTYLRRTAFELKAKPGIKEDYNYLTDFFTKYNIL
jgi:hypothetical protein